MSSLPENSRPGNPASILAIRSEWKRKSHLTSPQAVLPYCICTSPIQLANGGRVIEVVVAPINEGSFVSNVLTAVC
jgi:hypothetical protein